MAARAGGGRKPAMTVTVASGERLGQVRLREDPCVFARFEKGASTGWLQYVAGALFQVHRTYYVAEVDWDGRTLHEIEVEYYEPEFPDARLWMQWYVEQTDEAWRLVWWGQRYPNATAELRPQGRVMPRLLRPGAASGRHAVDPDTYILDNGGGKRVPCLRLWEGGGDGCREYFIDGQGDCLYGREWTASGAAPAAALEARETMEREGRRYVLAWEQIPQRMMWAVWASDPDTAQHGEPAR